LTGSAETGRQLPRAVRAALPLLGGQAVIFAVAFLQRPALLLVLDTEDFAAFGLLNETLRWAVVAGGLGLATGLLRMAPLHPRARGALLRRASLVILAASTLAVAGVQLLGPIALGDGPARAAFAVFGWKVPCIALAALALASLHAAGKLRAKAVVDALDKVLVLALAVGGAALDGLRGLVLGSLVASAMTSAIALRVATIQAGPSERPERGLMGKTFAVGRAHLAFMLVETSRRLLVLRLVEARGAGAADTAYVYAAMALTLPLIALPEMIAQAVYPGMVTERGERADLDASHSRLFREQALVFLPLLCLYGAGLWFVLPLLKGGAYAGAVAPALALLPGVAAHGLTAHTGYVVLVRDRLPQAVAVSALALAVAGAVAWWAIPVLGATGAALALSVALAVRGVALVLVARRRPSPQ